MNNFRTLIYVRTNIYSRQNWKRKIRNQKMVPLMGRCCGYLMTLPQLLDHLQNFHNLNDLITCYICENVNSLTAHLVEHMEQSDDDLVEQSTETDDDLVEHLAQPDNNLVKLLAQPDDDESIGNATSQYSRWPEIHPLDQPITNESNFEWVKKYDRLECSQFWSDEYGLELNHVCLT